MRKNTEAEPRRILLAVTGLSPQVVTETLYALAVQARPAWVPHEIHLITTGEGAGQARLNLLAERTGWFHRLRQDYGLPSMDFDVEHIHPIRDAAGRVLDDIRTPQDNEAAADFITERVRQLTLDPDAAVHASIAGGRKTMGFYLGYALSLYGRPQDRLSHVLVSAPFEGHPQFYYPTPAETILQVHQGGKSRALDAREARVTLASIPFVRLRQGQPRHLLEGTTSFSDGVAAAHRAQEPARLLLDLPRGRAELGGQPVVLPPADLAFYALLARRARAGEPPVRYTDPELAAAYLAEYARLAGRHSAQIEHAEARLTDPDLKSWFDERMSKTKRALLRALDPAAAGPFRMRPYGHRPRTRYGLALAPEAIHIIDEA